jgi:hypothetical protein
MIENNELWGLQIYVIVLITVVAIFYLYFFYKVIHEGYKRDLLGLGLIMVAILGSPFMAYAFVKSTKKDSNRVKVEFENNEGVLNTYSLSFFIKLKIPISSIRAMNDINKICRFCNHEFIANEKHCEKCNKKRKWFYLQAINKKTKSKTVIDLDKWNTLTDDYYLNDIISLKQPLEIHTHNS